MSPIFGVAWVLATSGLGPQAFGRESGTSEFGGAIGPRNLACPSCSAVALGSGPLGPPWVPADIPCSGRTRAPAPVATFGACPPTLVSVRRPTAIVESRPRSLQTRPARRSGIRKATRTAALEEAALPPESAVRHVREIRIEGISGSHRFLMFWSALARCVSARHQALFGEAAVRPPGVQPAAGIDLRVTMRWGTRALRGAPRASVVGALRGVRGPSSGGPAWRFPEFAIVAVCAGVYAGAAWRLTTCASLPLGG